MSDLDQLRRVAIAGVVLAIVVGAISVVLGLLALDWNLEALVFGDPDATLRAGPDGAMLWRWSMQLDIFYSYILLVPLALYGHRRLRPRRPWLADIGLIGALLYIGFGGAAAAILAVAGSSLIEGYAAAEPPDQAAIETSFRLLRDAFYFGIWQTLDAITAGTWVLTSGVLLLSERRALGRLLVLAGVGFWVLALMTMSGVHSLAVLAGIALGVLVLWLAWLAFANPRRAKTDVDREQVPRPRGDGARPR
jgi:hypothetical protein